MEEKPNPLLYSFDIIRPCAILYPFASHYWILKAGAEMMTGDRVVPFGAVSLVFHRAESMRSLKKGTFQPKAFISGISTGYADLRASGAVDMLVVVFRPLGAGIFLTAPAWEFRNSDISVEDAGDPGLAGLAYRICREPSDHKAVALLENFLISRLVRYDAYNHSRLASAVSLINGSPGVKVSDAAGAACLGTKQFNRLFSAWTGAKPKDFIRIVRFQRALSILQKESCTDLAQLAAACGYFDQAHMIKEFREFSGYTPSQYLSLCEPYSDYFTGT